MIELETCVNGWHTSGNYGRPGGIREFLLCPECSETRQYQLANLAREAFNAAKLAEK
jgi:hypothetical protein